MSRIRWTRCPNSELAAFSLVDVAQVDQEGDGLVVLLRFRGADQGVDALPGALAVPGERVQVPGPGEGGSPVACRAVAAFGGQPFAFCAVVVGVGLELGDGPAAVSRGRARPVRG